MKNQAKPAKTLNRVALLLVASMLAACGGGDDSAASSCKNPLLLIPCALTGQAQAPADGGVATGTSSGLSAFSGAVSTDGSDAEVTRFEAFEPNNTFDNANFVAVPFASDGVAVGGSLSGADDAADTFIFTPNRSGLHSIYICAETCASAAEVEGISVMLLDQTQTTVDSTVATGSSSLEIAANLTAGMAYYVQVSNNDFSFAGQDYTLVIVE